MSSWLGRLRDRHIPARERTGALATITLACLATLTLTLAAHRQTPHGRSTARQIKAEAPARQRTPTSDGVGLFPQVRQAAQAFLAGYLAYVDGQAPAGRIIDATPPLLAQLETRPPRVPPGMRELQPRLLTLQPLLAPEGLVALSATVNDGTPVDYSLQLLLETHTPQPLVAAIGDEQ